MVYAEWKSEAQRTVFETVIACLTNPAENGNAFLVEGAAGTGKTFLLNQLIAYCDSKDMDAIAIGWTGVAASQFPNGKTVHSLFRIPWRKVECLLDPKHRWYKAIRKASILVWDQAANCNKLFFEAVDQFLRSMMNSDQIFGGKVVVVCADFRECLPITRRSDTVSPESHSLLHSALFNQMKKCVLTDNYRFEHLADYRYCLEIGAGIQNEITVPLQSRINYLPQLINLIYYDFNSATADDFLKRSILTVQANDAEFLNTECLKLLCPNNFCYEAFNFFRKADPTASSQFFSFQNIMATLPKYFPPNLLCLNVNCPIMLTQTYRGLSQGTRLVVKSLNRRSITAEICSGERKGKLLKIYKVKIIKPFLRANLEFVRFQFPVSLSFAMTINKAQGLEFKRLGLYLPSTAFAHGQMYSAFSRVPFIERDLKVLVLPPPDEQFSAERLPNVVNQAVAHRFLPINI